MRLIFIRHGDPDYKNDNLTEKGKREAELLAKRVSKWNDITEFYTSPLGRAKATAKPSLELLDRKAISCDWLQEFYYRTKYPEDFFIKELAGKETMCWDFLPEIFYSDKLHFDSDHWTESAIMKEGKIREHYKEVCDGIDGILAKYGYLRNSAGFYDVKNPQDNPNFEARYSGLDKGGIGGSGKEKYQLVSEKNLHENCTLVFFCHLGIMFTIIAHLIGLSPMQLWQGFYVAPTSITILNTEERIRGQAAFRVERLGDTNHLTNGGEPISSSGYFTDLFHE